LTAIGAAPTLLTRWSVSAAARAACERVTRTAAHHAAPRWERRKDERPAQLLAAALGLFVERGYAATRLDDVAARAGVSKGTLYLYFENKEELFKAVVRENIVARISRTRQLARQFDGPRDELLRQLVRRWWQQYGQTPAAGISKLIVAESGNFPEIARFFVDEVIDPWHRLFSEVIDQGIERGEFRPVDVEYFVRVVAAPLVMLTLWNRAFGPCEPGGLDDERYLAAALDAFVAALRPPAAAASPACGEAAPGRRRKRVMKC
jgi:AcrR family transcriptional regulator